MIETIAIVLLVLWVLGFMSSTSMGGVKTTGYQAIPPVVGVPALIGGLALILSRHRTA